jgi:uncharacterized membrane protein
MSTYILSPSDTTSDMPQRTFDIPHLDVRQPFEWLRQGWDDLRAAPVVSLIYGLVVAALAFLFAYLTAAVDRFYLVPFLFSGFLIIAPFLSVGLMAMAKRRDEHQRPHTVSVTRILVGNAPSLTMMGLFLLLVFINWIMLSNLMFGGIFQEVLPTYQQVRPLPVMFLESLPFLAVFGGIAIILAAIVFRMTALSLPMLLDQKIDAFNATFASWRAVGENWRTMSVWALLIAALVSIATATFFLGLIVVIPWLGYASWHAYRDSLIPRAPSPTGGDTAQA